MSENTAVSEPPILSPCVRNCCLDDANVCLGCGRSITEIMGWSAASAAERRDILKQSRQRLQLRRDLKA